MCGLNCPRLCVEGRNTREGLNARAGVAWILQASHPLWHLKSKVLAATLEWKYFKVGLKWIQVRMHTVENYLLKVVPDAAQSCTKKAFRQSRVKYSERSAVQDAESKWSEHDFFQFGDKVMDVHANAQDQPLKMIPRHLLVEAIMQNLFVFSSINPTFIVTRAFCLSVTAWRMQVVTF